MKITYQKLSHTTGLEGPSQDPWTYEIYTFENNFKKVELRVGLVESLHVNGHKALIMPEPYDGNENHEQLFEEHTGMTVRDFQRTYSRIHNPKNCPKCGSKKREWFSGFPGEEFMACSNCGQIIDQSFDIGAVI
jgi:RNA polymerase subunit RPABC4/transcription elongation factor Spt4